MLDQLLIRNLAVIDAAEIELGAGFTVLTGETGAGKSILVDALALALGARADSKAVRTGAKRCEVTARFRTTDESLLAQWLARHDLDSDDNECLVRRVVGADGRSRGYINNQPVTMQTLQALGEQLLDICGQQAHQRLRHRTAQRELLDAFGDHAGLLDELQTVHAQWRAAREQLDQLTGDQQQRNERIELLGFQLRELDALNLKAGEIDELETELAQLANSGRIESALREALELLYDAEQGSAQAVTTHARQRIEDLLEVQPALGAPAGLLAEAQALLVESADELRVQLDAVEHDPAREALIGDRLDEARTLARKHRVDPGELPDKAEQLRTELDSLDASDDRLETLRGREAKLADQLRKQAGRLSAARRRAAGDLEESVTDRMQTLGMTGGRFSIALSELGEDPPGPLGDERVEFEVAANPGQAGGPLARVASGGELARISLALQVAARGIEGLATLIFDEVDSGVGGGVAEIVGTQLRELSDGRQVLCVTHLPQVASQADHHLRVVKVSDGETTRTAVKPLTRDERVEEIARMLGGVEITGATREHAREMLDSGTGRRAGQVAGS